MAQLVARFTVTGWDPHDATDIGEGWLSAIRMSKTFTAGLTGDSVALFVSSGDSDGDRAYVAVERVTGTTDDGRSGSFTIHHGGLESQPDTWFGNIVPRSGVGDFESWSGSARIQHDGQGAFVLLHFDDPTP